SVGERAAQPAALDLHPVGERTVDADRLADRADELGQRAGAGAAPARQRGADVAQRAPVGRRQSAHWTAPAIAHAAATSAARLSASARARMADTCSSTVPGAMPSSTAMRALVWPARTRASTSAWRGVS